MQFLDVLPDVPLRAAGDVTALFLATRLQFFRAVAEYLHHLPYGRNTQRDAWRLVISEGRGTCSTKHALLAALAAEQGIEAKLTLGVFDMTARNSPGVGPVLVQHQLPYIPEAHCYIRYRHQAIDITRAGSEPREPLVLRHEETIQPDQIGTYKVAWHQRFIRTWVDEVEVAENGPGKKSGRFARRVSLLWRNRDEPFYGLVRCTD